MNIIFKLIFFSVTAISIQSCNLFSAAGLSSQGQPTKEVDGDLTQMAKIDKVLVDHSSWDTLLKTYVDEAGFVNYKGFNNDKDVLDDYLQMLSQYIPDSSWDVQELLAYYINTYNAYTVGLILDNYPLKSIKDINGAWTKAIIPIGKNNLSLGGLENGVLRKMNEPRIHFAINCASISCPKLLNEAFSANEINEQLDKVTFEFINSDQNDISEKTIYLSPIFDWYERDFENKGTQVLLDYINKYSNIQVQLNTPVKFKEYNWNLNEQIN